MKKSEIRVGGHYLAKVSGKVVTVRVDAIRERTGKYFGGSKVIRDQTMFDVTNLATGRKTTFRSAAKFRSEVKPTQEGARRAEYRKTDCPACDGFGTLLKPKGGKCPTCGGTGKRSGGNQLSEPLTDEVGREEGEQGSDPTSARSAVKTLTSATATKPFSAVPKGVPQTKEGDNGPDPTASVPTAVARSSVSAHVGKTSGLGSALARSVDSSSRHAPHLIIEARAGTGKTTTLVEGLKVVKGLPTSITPSPQQQAIWDQLALSKGCGSVCFVAFNKSIATELQRRVPAGCDAMTMHSMGFKAVQKVLGRMQPDQYVVQDIICDLLGVNLLELRRTKLTVLKATEDLVGLCKQTLIGQDFSMEKQSREEFGTAWDDRWVEQLSKLVSHYEVDLNNSRQEVFDLVPRVLERCQTPRGKINFDDMIWLPVVLNLPVYRYDLLLVDECQDLNRGQQALAKKAGRRLVLCGDSRQAVYGFAGADAESMKRMEEELGGMTLPGEGITDGPGISLGRDGARGCVTLPLTVTRRCGKAIVKEAQRIVPDFEAHESNPEGKISHAAYPEQKTSGQLSGGVRESRPLRAGETDYQTLVLDGDFLLCRVNAPLVSQCFRFIKAGRKATIQGRDIGAGLVATVKKTRAVGVTELVSKLDDWHRQETAKEQAKTNPNEAKLIALTDRYDCLLCFTEGVSTVEQVITKIESVFTDDKETPGIRLSSIHKAKGLEAKRVFLLRPKGGECPHPMAKSDWAKQQEWNLLYVAITRAIEELIYVS